jgi:hypothetical protein
VPEVFVPALAKYTAMSPRHNSILESWREHPNKADPWRALQSAAAISGKAVPVPEAFIGAVLGATMPASRLNDHTEQVRERFEILKRQLTQVISDAIYPLDLWRDLANFEAPLRDLNRSDYDMDAPAAGGRSDVNQSRDRKLFALRMLRYYEHNSGQVPSSKEVTTLLDIAFPEIATDERLVRQWFDEVRKPAV